MARAVPPTFRNRGEDISRLEGFSDTAFGFAITLLVVSLAAPTHFTELLQLIRGLPAFAVTFFLVATIWYSQYTFFRRYGLGDLTTVILNLALLFVVLFYVYPLKFLFGLVFSRALTRSKTRTCRLSSLYMGSDLRRSAWFWRSSISTPTGTGQSWS